MDLRRRSTSMRLFPPSILVIACAPVIVERCRITSHETGLSVHVSDLQGAYGLATERRPVALVLPDDLLDFEEREFADLAKDVGATMIQVDAHVCEREIGAMLAGAIDTYIRRRDTRQGAGRYCLIGKGIVDVVSVPGIRKAEAPKTCPPPSGLRTRETPRVGRVRAETEEAPLLATSLP
jgi:hypothetical protein